MTPTKQELIDLVMVTAAAHERERMLCAAFAYMLGELDDRAVQRAIAAVRREQERHAQRMSKFQEAA